MFPPPHQFSTIDREALVHPDVAAEIEAAGRRAAQRVHGRRRGLVAMFGHPTRWWRPAK